MELTGKMHMKSENYVHCSICGNYRNINSFAHKKSAAHQKKLSIKLRKVSFYLSQTKKKPAIIHDVHWPGKDSKRFCHFCVCEYAEHYIEDEFVTENLGYLYHHSSCQHYEFVKRFLKQNFRDEKPEKYFLKSEEIDNYLSKVSDEKEKYKKKMDILNELSIKQIRDAEKRRKEMCDSQLFQIKTSVEASSKPERSVNENMIPVPVMHDSIKLPPWLDDTPSEFSGNNLNPVIGPTIDTLLKHEESKKNKGLSKKRVGANFQHHSQSCSSWLPSFQGVWNKTHRKHLRNQFLRRYSKTMK